jgi:hypothetical protein
MKKSKLIVGGLTLGLLAGGFYTISKFKQSESNYAFQELSSAGETQSPDGFKEWWDIHHFNHETGAVATPEEIQAGLNEARMLRASQPRVTSLAWSERGPENVGGRTRAVCIDRTNENHVYAAGVSGGVFESFNKGNNWQRVEDWDAFMYIMAIEQTNDGTIFVGTGSGAFREAGVGGKGVWYKNPNDPNDVWKAIPGTSAVPGAVAPGNSDWDIIELATSGVDNKVYIASDKGLHVWDKNVGGNPVPVNGSLPNAKFYDVAVSGDGQVILARSGVSISGGVWASQNAGQSFANIMGAGLPIPTNGGNRMEFAISKNKVNGKYICYAMGTNAHTAGGFRSADSGETWSQIVTGTSNPDADNNFYGLGQGDYNSTCAVDPTNPNRFLIGGLDIHQWTLATANPVSGGWNQLSLWFAGEASPLYVHADNHKIKFASDNRMYIGNDGGIGISENIGQTFFPANRGYATIQFYSLAVDGNGRLLGGTQDNGTLYNSLNNATIKEFRRAIGGDGFDCAISYFNPAVQFGTLYYGAIFRTGTAWSGQAPLFVPDYQGYMEPGGLTSGVDWNFNYKIGMGEFYDENSLDSVKFSPSFSATSGTQIEVPSAATGNLIPYTLSQNVYFSDSVFFNPSLTVTDFIVTDTSGASFQLYPLTWNYTQGTGNPAVGDIIQVTAPTTFTIVVDEVSTYQRYFAQGPNGKILDLVTSEFVVDVAWDTLTVADPYQSIFLCHARKFGGELYMTRDATRLSSSNVKWSRLVTGIGDMSVGEIAFSANLEHVYVGTQSGLWRIDGIRDVYSSQSDFIAQTDLRQGAAPAITKTLIHSGTVSGISVNPQNPGDVVITLAGSNGNILRSTTAHTATSTGTFTSVKGNLPNNVSLFDALIDRENSNLLLVGTAFGLYVSNNGGTTWNYSSEGFGEVPVTRIAQNWREGHPNTSRPGEIYIATYGRGMFASDSVLDIYENATLSNVSDKFKITVYPNPMDGQGTVQFDLAESGQVEMEVYSISGRLISKSKTYLDAGVNNLDLDASKLENGAYIVRINAGKQQSSAKFIKR